MNPFLSQGGGSSATSSSRSGDIGALSFGGFGGIRFGDDDDINGIDPRWLIGAAVVAGVLVVAFLVRKK